MGLLLKRYAIWIVLIPVCAVSAVGLWPYSSTMYHLEAGGRALATAEAFRANHPQELNPALDQALRHLQRATEISPQDGFTYRRLGQAWLLSGNNEAAREALSRAAVLRPDHPLIQIELGYAYDGLGQVDKALEAYEKGGYGPAVEAAIVNYLKVADWQAGAGAGDYALTILKKVLALDPNNLPALYRMMDIYAHVSEQADAEFAQPLRERLRDWPEGEISLPTEPRLMSYTKETISSLVEQGIWPQEKADRVLVP